MAPSLGFRLGLGEENMHNPAIAREYFKSRGIVLQAGDVASKKVSTAERKDGALA
jgi:hypothetical protein